MKQKLNLAFIIIWTVIFSIFLYFLILDNNDQVSFIQNIKSIYSKTKIASYIFFIPVVFILPYYFLFVERKKEKSILNVLEEKNLDPKEYLSKKTFDKINYLKNQNLQLTKKNQELSKNIDDSNFQLRAEINTLNGISSMLDSKSIQKKENLEEILTLYKDTIKDMKMRFNIDFQESKSESSVSKETKTLKIVVTEDNLKNQIIIKKILERDGHKVELFENGKEALNFLENQDCDLVLMDCMMPVMDGFEATKEIRKLSNQKNLPILALTSFSSDKEHQKCFESGMDDIIVKPFDIIDLKKKIQKYT